MNMLSCWRTGLCVVALAFVPAVAARGATVLDLADIVGGGDGTGTGAAQGIDLNTGLVALAPTTFVFFADNVVNYVFVPALPFVDGVFNPDGGAGAVTLNSSGDTYLGMADISPESWDHVWNGPIHQGSNLLDGVDYTAPGRSMIGFHANKGLTFDLDAIEAVNVGLQAVNLSAVIGLDDVAGPLGSVDYWVFVDGDLGFVRLGVSGAHAAEPINVPIPAGARFLTLAVTDSGGNIAYDHSVFGDPRLTLAVPLPSAWMSGGIAAVLLGLGRRR